MPRKKKQHAEEGSIPSLFSLPPTSLTGKKQTGPLAAPRPTANSVWHRNVPSQPELAAFSHSDLRRMPLKRLLRLGEVWKGKVFALRQANPAWRLRGIGPETDADRALAFAEETLRRIATELALRGSRPVAAEPHSKPEEQRKPPDETLGVGKTYLQPQPKAEGQEPKKVSPWYESDPDVLHRRQIVLKNPNLSAKQLCGVFDTNRIPLPPGWEDKFNVTTWLAAYKIKKLRANIQRIISTDRKQE